MDNQPLDNNVYQMFIKFIKFIKGLGEKCSSFIEVILCSVSQPGVRRLPVNSPRESISSQVKIAKMWGQERIWGIE